jgi:hypothetical protein
MLISGIKYFWNEIKELNEDLEKIKQLPQLEEPS